MNSFSGKLAALAVTTALLAFHPTSGLSQNSTDVDILIDADGNTRVVEAAVERFEGRLTQRYQNLEIVAATVPALSLNELREVIGAESIMLDRLVPVPTSIEPYRTDENAAATSAGLDTPENISAIASKVLEDADAVQAFAENNPGAYLLNHSLTNVRDLHARGITGDGVVVAVIDTGLRPGFPHLSGSSVLECEDVTGTGGCGSDDNSGHGTMVSSMVTGRTIYTFDPAASFFLNSVHFLQCDAILENDCSGAAPTGTGIAMIGAAPMAKIYAFKVFAAPDQPGTASDVLTAVDRIIELKRSGLDIGVANLSLGKETLYAGRDPLDVALDALLRHDILPVVSAGNAGPASLTVASPATGGRSLAVGAGGVAHQERLGADLAFSFVGAPPGIAGTLIRPSGTTQTSIFSSRGPNANGNISLDLLADGAVFGAGLSTAGDNERTASMGNGTSFSAPLVSGIAALLREAFPRASASRIQEALLRSANPGVVEDGSRRSDQGYGYVDASAAYRLLDDRRSHLDENYDDGRDDDEVSRNMRRERLRVHRGTVELDTGPLSPGERFDILYAIPEDTVDVSISVANISPALPFPAGPGDPACFAGTVQNCWFPGDFIRLNAHSAKTSTIQTIASVGDYFDISLEGSSEVAAYLTDAANPFWDHVTDFAIVDPDSTRTFGPEFRLVEDNLEPGVLRITLTGDFQNAGGISAKISISSTVEGRHGLTSRGRITGEDFVAVPIEIPEHVEEAVFRLTWDGDWGSFPTNDLDVFLFAPDGTQIAVPIFAEGIPFPVGFEGITKDAPEVVRAVPPLFTAGGFPLPGGEEIVPAGEWTVVVFGFEINTRNKDNWRLRVTADGELIEAEGDGRRDREWANDRDNEAERERDRQRDGGRGNPDDRDRAPDRGDDDPRDRDDDDD